MTSCMIDLETLDTRATSVIVSVGAVIFDEKEILNSFYCVLDRDEQIKAGRTVSASTINWWMKQSDQARSVFADKEVALNDFGFAFMRFCSQYEKLFFWGNGSDFDLSIMIDLWQRHSLHRISSWKYSNHMCFRTFNKIHDCKKLVERKGVHHNALDDAKYQAECVLAAIRNGAKI